jgi:hypothetical protein
MTDATHIYLDLDVVNNDQLANNDPPPLRFQETRTTPLISGDTNDYYCSILRFSIQTGNTLPIFIPRIQTGQTDPDLTVYNITLVWKDSMGVPFAEETEYLRYVPWNNQPKPLAPTTSQDLSGTYYYMNNFTQFQDMLNAALSAAWNRLESGPSWRVREPFVEFDSTINRFILNTDFLTYSSIDIYFNTRLYELLSSFPAHFEGNPGDKNYRIDAKPNPGNTNVHPRFDSTGTDLRLPIVQSVQETSTFALFNPIASIVFSTSLIPIIPTNTSPPMIYGDNSTNLVSGGNNANLTNIITDFEVPVSELNQYRPSIEYVPSTEYRLIDMNKLVNLNQVDLAVFWKTHYGNYVPFRLQPGCSAHIKILFRSKQFNHAI